MQTRSQHGRRTTFSALLLVVQVAVAAAVPLADAVLERIARDGPAHVESQNGVPCPPGHDHLLCQFCRMAGATLLLSTAAVASPRLPALIRTTPPHTVDVLTAAVTAGPIGPRAPPIA